MNQPKVTRDKATRDMVQRSLERLPLDGHEHEDSIRSAIASGFDEEDFHVGDDVVSTCGSMAGIIIAITGDEALISWTCRGKSVETLDHLIHVEHQNV